MKSSPSLKDWICTSLNNVHTKMYAFDVAVLLPNYRLRAFVLELGIFGFCLGSQLIRNEGMCSCVWALCSFTHGFLALFILCTLSMRKERAMKNLPLFMKQILQIEYFPLWLLLSYQQCRIVSMMYKTCFIVYSLDSFARYHKVILSLSLSFVPLPTGCGW